MMIPTQEFLELLARGSNAHGKAAARDRDEEEGADADHQPPAAAAASPATGAALLKGVTPDGDTALHAVARNRKGGQHFLRYAGIIYDRDPGLLFRTNQMGDTPLHCAARAGNSKMVSHLMDLAGREGAHTKLISLLRMENKRHETALHEAVRFQDGRVLLHKDRAALLAHDAADPAAGEGGNNKDDENNIVKLLMGVDPDLANYPARGISPLYLAILLGKSTIAVTLYHRSGGNLSYAGEDGQNALHVAVLQETDTVIIEFLVHWNKTLVTQVDKDGSTPLHFAASLFQLRPETLKILFKANRAALYQADNNGFFPIHVAASVGLLRSSYGAINNIFLRECPDSVGLRDSKGRTFLHVAVEKERRLTVFFVRRTPSLSWILNMQDNEGNTALHLAIQAKSFRMVCALIGNKEVNLNLINNKGETPMDIAGSKLPCGIGYFLNPENKIYSALMFVGAKHGALHRDKTKEMFSWHSKPKEEDEAESDKLKDATQTLIVASALIATVAFSATFALPGGYRADDHTNGGTPTLAGSFVFDAFMVATTLAFTCSTLATIGFAFAAAPMVNLVSRRVNFVNSLLFMSTSITCMTFAFALGVYMVLAPVARNTAVAVCVIIPAILLVPNMEEIFKWLILAAPLMLRKGTFPGMVLLLQIVGMKLWPCIVIFGWAALARIHVKH
uniref:Uncharacterized protein n=1 Tax=Avena sativa TaxID=4498 RepID=A0ACD5XTV7_AVESA